MTTSNKKSNAREGDSGLHTVPIGLLDAFPGHPYQIRLDEDMDQLVESIRANGLLSPITLRPKEDGRYEIVSGHRRAKACELIGLDTIRADVREMTQDEAVIMMVDSNLQRSKILPSEKAFSYKMRLDAMKRQAGRPRKENLVPLGRNISREALSQETGDSQTQIQRYIRLTNLHPDLLAMVDEGKIALRPAVEISYLTKEEQSSLLETIGYEDATPSLAQAIKMRAFSKDGKLCEDVILSIMCERKPNQREKISFRTEKLKPFLPKNITPQQTEDYILKALEHYHRYRERQKEQNR